MPNYSTLNDHPDEDRILIHEADPSNDRLSLIDDLDSFFVRIYQYHQRHGFCLIVLKAILVALQFLFIIFLAVYLRHGINYPVLFKDIPPPTNSTKVTLSDVLLPINEVVSNFGGFTWLTLILAAIFFILKLIRGIYSLSNFWEIKRFYNDVLKIHDSELDNLTWHEVQTKLRKVQKERKIIIHKDELTELDIYHRILRQENYLVAMVNKKLIPPTLHVPFLGEIVYWTAGLRFNMQILFFWSPFSPFAHPWQLKDEYKKPHMRQELARQFKQLVLILCIANGIFCPVIIAYQFFYAILTYGAVIRREPGILALRRWSLYGRLYLRHFNELDHELQARLTRAHRPASKYMSAFYSPTTTLIAEGIGFFVASLLTVFIIFTIYDEDVITVEFVLLIMTVLTLVLSILRQMLPDETVTPDLEELLTKVLHNTHYLPAGWKGQAHKAETRKKFQQIFQYSFAGVIESVLSPLLTSYILWRHVYPRSIEYVDFFRNFTINVAGVGDVCSFAQMDLRQHGNPEWHQEEMPIPDQYSQCEDGKVEISLVHFKSTNPDWVPPESVQEFVKNVQNRSLSITSPIQHQMEACYIPILQPTESVHASTLPPLASVDVAPYTFDVWRNNISFHSQPIQDVVIPQPHTTQVAGTSQYLSRQNRFTPENQTTHTSRMFSAEGNSPFSFREMSLTADYLHTLHNNMTEVRVRNTAQETTPLLQHD